MSEEIKEINNLDLIYKSGVQKAKTHSSIALKIETKTQLETYRKYPRETYDEILDRLFSQIESRKGKKKESATLYEVNHERPKKSNKLGCAEHS